MSDAPIDRQAETERVLRMANLLVDTLLKQAQSRTEIWKVVVSALTAGGALVAAGVALAKFFT